MVDRCIDKAARLAKSRLRLRPCKWHECDVVVDSEEKLLEHLKEVHVERAKAEKGSMVSSLLHTFRPFLPFCHHRVCNVPSGIDVDFAWCWY